MSVKDFEQSKNGKELHSEDYINNVIILAYTRKKNRGREIPSKWAALIADKDEKYLEFKVDKYLYF